MHCIANVTFFFTAIFIIALLPPSPTKPNFQSTLPGFFFTRFPQINLVIVVPGTISNCIFKTDSGCVEKYTNFLEFLNFFLHSYTRSSKT
jgi:hypothetical protein